MNINKVSQSIVQQSPNFLEEEYPLFNRFLEYYYQSQEKTGAGQNIINNFLNYLDIDKLDIGILDGKTKIVEAITDKSTKIVVESIEQFLSENGSILIGDEVIYYESTTSSPNIALSPGISYEQVKLKWTNLASPIDLFDGSTTSFGLTSQDNPIAPPSAQHLIVSVYGEVLIPAVDYTVSGTDIVFTNAPRTRLPSDDSVATYITYLNGFVENTIVAIDNLSGAFGDNKVEFKLTRNGNVYEPIVDEYVLAVYDNTLLVPKVDFFIDGDKFIFANAPINGRFLSLYSVEAPIPSFGNDAVGYARVNDNGELSSISINNTGSGYRFEYPPQVSINSTTGGGGSATALVNGIKNLALLEGGQGYSDTNPPTVTIQTPTKSGSKPAVLKATVTNGSVTGLETLSSGSGYTFTPRITFTQPGGATLGPAQILAGSLSGTITVTNGGQGYSTAPTVYIDEPTGENGIRAALRANLTDGQVTSITILNAGQGYETTPRVAIVDPVGAQVLETTVDSNGRVTNIELLSGGSGYDDIPSVFIVDNRVDGQGNYAGGTGAKATAAIFNGRITDINITEFGAGYSSANPPTIVIQDPPQAKASAEIGLNEITGFTVNLSGTGYQKAQFVGCARAASGITSYTEDGNAVFSNDTTAVSASLDTEVKCLDALFVKRLLDKYTEQFLPDVPELDYKEINVRNAIKTIKDFYSTKGTSFSISYLFKLLYGEQVSISYPKDQIIKPSAATWSIDTILRATLVSGNPVDIQDGLLQQDLDIADPNIQAASALVENYIAIRTSETDIYELVLSEETITGSFTVPYKTKLAEPLGTEDSIITVDSTIGWPERNGEFLIGNSEVVQYKEKSLNQFIECTRSVNGIVEDWDSATEVSSNFRVFINKGTSQEVVMNVVGIVDAQQTTLTDTGSYYLPGDKLTISKLGGTGTQPELNTWLYNVKKLIEISSITFGGINNRSATVTCSNPHGLLVGDQVTIYGANPIIYNGTFLVTSRDSTTVFQYQLPQPATVVPQGNILVSIDLNKGKSETAAINNTISPYTTNIQNSFFNDDYVYVASTGIPNYNIGPFPGSALLPGNQRKLNRFPRLATTISTKNEISSGPIGTWINGVSAWSYKSTDKKTFGAVTDVAITNAGKDYDAASPPAITISGGGGSGATASVVVNGSLSEIVVTDGGSGYTSSPLISIVGGGGSGAAATAIITKGVVSRVLINDGGTGYTSQPSITIVGGGGTGATATAEVRGPIKSVSVTNGGASYTSKPSVVLSSGSGAVAQAIVQNGRIISIAIISAGSGYTTAPEIGIQGDGFGAVARATIDTDGENAGRVTGIEIVNRGIGYSQGTTVINLTAVGQDALFDATVFQWTYNLQETATIDSAKGSVFEGFNNQYGGEYAHLSNPQRLRYILGDNLYISQTGSTIGQTLEQNDSLEHSPIIGWAFDGNPIYGPYGYQDPTDQGSTITRLNSSYRVKPTLIFDAQTNPYPVRTAGPLLTDEAAGRFVEDYEYVFGLGDLDQYNGRFCKTPQFPTGRYCYFVTIDNTEQGNAVFPYILGPSYNSVVDKWNLSATAVQQNIPTGVVRYRDPYENVDIDVERAPNASTNALTLENGDNLLFEVEDEDRSGVIDQAEIDDPDQIFEESPLQLFDYFPKVKFDSKVDIEVETITKFEDASVTGFTVENPGISYQVNDRLVFDNTDTDGTGVSARVSRIKGETVSSYNFENVSGDNFGILQTSNPHNLIVGDTVYVDYTPIMNNTNKTFVVRQLKGVEEVVITQTGSGYNSDIPPVITLDGDGNSASLQAVVTSVGSIDTVNIINSGSSYTTNPRVIISHPQVFKKADYFVSTIDNNDDLVINDSFTNADKETFICGRTKDAGGNGVGFLAKLSSTGLKEWEKTLESGTGTFSTEHIKLAVDGNDIWIVGENKPNASILDSYNPDIYLAKYVQADNGLSATLTYQRGYAGISGSSREDRITSVLKYSDTRVVIGGFTNTNSTNPYDAFIGVVDTTGSFVAKRKVASSSGSEKLTAMEKVGDDIYFTMESASTANAADIDVSFGKAILSTSSIAIEWVKNYTNTLYSFMDTSMVVDEFDEAYISATLRLKSDDTTKDSFWVGKVNTNGDLLWNYRYLTGSTITMAPRSNIDIFGDLNVALTKVNSTNQLKTVETVKLGYDGKIKNHTSNEFNKNNIEGITVKSVTADNSGDVYAFGQSSWNRNEFLVTFAGATTSDITTHYTPVVTGTSNQGILVTDGKAQFFGYDVAQPSNWENTNIKFTAAELGTKLAGDFTIEYMLYKDSSNSGTLSQTQETLFAIGDATDTTGGLWMYYDVSSGELQLVVTNNSTTINAAGSALQSTLTTMYADNTWQFIGLKKVGDTFTGYVNGLQVFTGSVTNTALGGKDLHFGNIPGRSGTTGQFRSNEQGQHIVTNLRLRNRALTPTVPSDVTAFPTAGAFGLTFDWVDDAWFTTNLNRYDYIDYNGWGLKADKDALAARIGTYAAQTNTGVGFVRTAITPVIGSSLTVSTSGAVLAAIGFQNLDFDDASINMPQDTEALTYAQDVWGSRTATVPSPGSQKLKATANVKNKYYFKVAPTIKIDNVQELTINQSFKFTVGTKLVLRNGSSFVNSGYIISQDTANNKVYLAVNNNSWSNDLNLGLLSTEQFSEQSTYGIVGPIPNDINEIASFTFPQINNTTPGTFDIDLNDFNHPEGGSNNLDELAKFKPYSDDDYSIRIDEISGSSTFIPGSVININSGDISFNAAYTTAQITNLTGVLKITLIANLQKTLQATAVANSDLVYIITGTRHYLSEGEMIFIDGNPSQEVGGVVYDEYDGSFPVNTVVSPLEFTYKLPQAAVSNPATSAGSVNVFVKSPVLKMYYGHQYLFDVSHSSLAGGNLSFSKDNLNKLEYSFNSIERVGTPGVTGQGVPTPTVKLKVDRNIVTNISYYFDPSRTGDDSPVTTGSYLDVVDSPYVGTFTISGVSGATITRGADTIKFPLVNEPEGAADIIQASYSTSSVKAVGSISDVRIVNPGGFYTRLPVVTTISSNRQIERVQINEPGTEYAVGTYNSVPIAGDGEGGFVRITVADGTDDEGVNIPGQIQEVVVTSPGKGYTTASIDIEAIDGILGAGLTGSGAELDVVIPAFGSGASIFTKGTNVGKIKKLKNNNFGYDYPHDYTLRPEITFPINAQLTSTSILSSITVTDPGSGYSQAPAVIITGGGGSGATAVASIKNGRLDQIEVKDPGAGYSSTPSVSLRSSFNYVVNLDLGLLQFAFPHGIPNGSEVTLNVVDTGEGTEFPLASGAIGRLNGNTTYYAIAGTANSLEPDQLKLAITAANAALGDAITFSNAGTGRQQVLTESFGGAATANVITSTFLEGELVYQGDSFETATAQGFVSTNNGWQVGPRVLKIVDYTGDFIEGQRITGVISKSSGVISDLNIAKGVLEIGSITRTTGQFIDDVGKPSEIIQKIQDSYYYQDFSYAVKSAVSIDEWKEILIKNVHPASFKVFGELNLNEYGSIPNKETDFELTKSVELAREAIVPNIQSFSLVEPIYSEFNNTEVLFRQKRLTSSENILTSVVQRLDDISNLFDGVRISFPLTVDGDNIVANANQLMIILNGVVQTPGVAFEIQGDSIVFAEPPAPPASVKYVNIQIEQIDIDTYTFTNQSGIFPNVGNTMVGSQSGARLTVTNVIGDTIEGFVTEGTFIANELVNVSATGFNANLGTITPITNLGLFVFGEQVKNFDNDTAKVEQINLDRGQETPLGQLRYSIGPSTTSVEIIASGSQNAETAPPTGTFIAGKSYQFGSEIVLVTNIVENNDYTQLTVTRGTQGTTAVSHLEDLPVYGTEINVTNALTLSKTAGTYQSTPGLYDIQLNDIIIGAQSRVVARVTATAVYTDPATNAAIGQVNISDGSSFSGLLFNRIAAQTYPNIVLDNISESQINLVDFADNSTAIDSQFPSNEIVSTNIIPYDNASGALTDGEVIRNYKISYGNNSGDFGISEPARIRKLAFKNRIGEGFFAAGQVIRTRDTKAEVIGYNQAKGTIYLGKIGRTQSNGQDYHAITFTNATINTYNQKYGTGCLALSPGVAPHTFVSGVTDAITAGNGASGQFTAATGTTYDPATGLLVLEIGTHSLTTSNTVTIADDGVVFTCAQDNNTTNKAYPRSTDTASGSALAISATTSTTITVNVGAVPIDEYVSIPSSAEFGVATGNYTIEFWVKPFTTSLSGTKTLVDMRAAGATEVAGRLYLEAGQVRWNSNGSDLVTSGLTTLSNDVWSHIAVSRTGTTAKIFINGAEVGTGTDSSNYGAKPIRIGANYAGSEVLAGYIDDFRFSNNARYTATFVAPTGIVQGDTNTRLLIHFDGSYGQTYTEDWSGAEGFTNGEDFNNDAILRTTNANGSAVVTGFTGNSQRYYDAANLIVANSDFIKKEVVDQMRTRYPELVVPGTRYTPTGATYDATTGLLSMTVSGNLLTNGGNVTPNSATYNAATGALVITAYGHSVTNGQKINIKVGGIRFTCTQDSNASNHDYPRATDPAAGAWLTVSNVTTNTFEVNVGASPSGQQYTHTFVSAVTNCITIQKDRIKINDNALTFTCSSDNDQTQVTYPRVTDPASKQVALPVVSASANNLTVNVGTSPFVYFQPSNATYDPATGDFVMTIANHTINTGTKLKLKTGGFTFTCDQDSNQSQHTYPRSTDPSYNTTIAVTAVGTTTADITGATYNPTTGELVITSNGHGLSAGNRIQIADNSLTFTCAYDSNATNHTYPRQTDPIRGEWVEIQSVTTNTITLNVGVSSDTSTHTFVSATSGALIKQTGTVTVNVGVSGANDQYAHTFVSAETDAVITGGAYVHTFVSAVDNSVIADQRVNCEDDIRDILNALVQDLRNGSNNHMWDAAAFYVDRTQNPVALSYIEGEIRETLFAYEKVNDMIQYVINNVLWTVQGSHGLTQFTDATITDSTTGVLNQFTPTGATYDAATGDLVITIGSHSLTTANRVRLLTGGITFTCDDDGNERQIAYPRSTDPANNAVLPITAVSQTTITVNVGASPVNQQYAHTYVSALSNAVVVLDYSLSDCADVWSTAQNLLDILTDTLTNANASTPVDHLASVTKVSPAVESLGGTVDAFSETPFTVDYHSAGDDEIYTNQIDEDAQYRFRDASGLIRVNRGAIVDKAAADMLSRYPSLAQDMPRNQNGGSTDGTLRCKTDLGLILDAIANDIERGGNEDTVQAAKFYIGGSGELLHIRLQVWQSVYAHERLAYYAKQAITGDLDDTNTDNLIVGDWGITNDAGGCANVKSAIDTLVTTINDIIAPTGEDFNVGGDRLYFNRQYIAEEITGMTTNEFTYDLNGTPYSAFSYPGGTAGETKCQRDLKLIMLGIISDLQTGGNNSTIAAIETYLTSDGTLNHVEDELLATVFSVEKIKILAERAIRNELYTQGNSVTGNQYAAQYTNEEAYRDSESTTDINQVVWRMRELVEIAVDILAPGDKVARSASKNILYNLNYYKEELTNVVNSQFGSGAYVYNSFVDEMINNIVHDSITTDVKKKTTAQKITLTGFSGGSYIVGETAISSSGGTATILEWDEENLELYIGPVTGSAFADGNTVSGLTAGTGTIASSGVSTGFTWYTEPGNVEVLESARNITSNVQGQVSTTNLFPYPENFSAAGFVRQGVDVNDNLAASATGTSGSAPDGTQTADQLQPNLYIGQHWISKAYNISAFETFDSGNVKFDSGTETFDTGNIGTAETQTYTYSVFLKDDGSSYGDNVRLEVSLDNALATRQQAYFDIDLSDGTYGTIFQPQGGITVDAYGVIPYGNGWYRAYLTLTFGFGFGEIEKKIFINGAGFYQGTNQDFGPFAWGYKLNKGALDPYTAQSGQIFYSDAEFNIKNFILDELEVFITSALSGTLTSPSTNAGFFSFYDSTVSSDYTVESIDRLVRNNFDIIRGQLQQDSFYTNLTTINGITVPSKVYEDGSRIIPVGIAGGVNNTDYLYGTSSDNYGEIESLSVNEGTIVQIYKRFRIDGTITDGPFTMGESVQKQGDAAITGVVYGFTEDENFKYLDVRVTAGTWAITDTIIGATQSTSAQISAIEDRIQINKVKGSFTNDIIFKGYTSGNTASPTGYLTASAAILDNSGGSLTVDTETLVGTFEKTATLFPDNSELYFDVVKYDGLDVAVGDRVNSAGHVRLGISVQSGLNQFTVGDKLHKVNSNFQDANFFGYITEVDLDNNLIYAIMVGTNSFGIGDFVGSYGPLNDPFNPIGYAQVSTKIDVPGAASGIIRDIRTIGIDKRLYISDVRGTFSSRDGIVGPDSYKSAIKTLVNLKGRVKRYFRGFDGTQTNFKLTIENGTPYFPDPAGHMLIFINGVLQPPGATFAYTAFSDEIQFTEAPDLGASFTGFYVGKLRQLDDISFEFDSLRQSFNLKRDDVFYSLTLTEGVQSTTIRPENNIIVSLNGVLQEPGVGFEIVGSRIIFSEIPRFGSTFVAFSYVGSEADVDAAEVVPPVEAGDFIDIQGETEDREVAVIESSNSLITFDYLGSVFGQNARGTALLTSGTIDKVQITSGGSGYTSRPTVRIDSISGFDGNIRALVGVGAVEVSATGTGYQNPEVVVETSVPDDWTAPDLSQYGEELVDPETP